MGSPIPLKTRPSISSETGISIASPVNVVFALFEDSPEVDWNTWIVTVSPSILITFPLRICPEAFSLISTTSP